MKKFLLWTAAVVVTLAAVVYQFLVGPTQPLRHKITISDTEYSLTLVRSQGSEKFQDAELKIDIADPTVSGKVFFRRYPTTEEWENANLVREERKINSFIKNKLLKKYEESILVASLPYQPPAGKLEYYIVLTDGDTEYSVCKDTPVKVRFSGAVPPYLFIPHIIFIFFALFASTITGFYAIWRFPRFRIFSLATLVTIALGGIIFGPIVQRFAFGEFWSGLPLGWDLTDNKTLVMFVAWGIAVIKNWNEERRVYSIVAAALTLIAFAIPHGILSAELDLNSGKIIQTFIPYLW